MPRRSFTVWVSVAALLACALGCTGGEPADAPHDGPLRFGGEPGTLCLTAGSATDFTLAFDAARNSTKAEITVDQVRLVDAHDATMVAAYLAPIIDLTLIGVMRGWPPQEGSSRAFEQRKPVPATVAARSDANVVVHIRARPPADVKAVELTYTSDGRHLRVRNSTSFMIRDKCS